MNSQPLDGYQYPFAPPPYQPMMDQSHQWLALPTTTMGSLVHAQPPMPQQTWAFMNPALGTTTTFSQVPVVGVMPQMGDMIPAPMPPTIHMMPEPTQYEPVPLKKTSSKPKGRSSKSANKADKYASGLTQYTTFYDGGGGGMGTHHQSLIYDIEPPPPKKGSSKKSAQPQQEIYTIGEEHRYIKRKNSQSRKLEQAKRRVMGQVMDDMMPYPRCMTTPLTPSYTYVNDLDATQTQMSLIQPTYTPMQLTQQWGPTTAIPTTMATIMTPSSMLPMKMPVANAYTAINTVQLPMAMEQIPTPHGTMPMEMMMEPPPPMAPPMQKATMMPMMASQPMQAVPVPVLPPQGPGQGVVMEPVVTKTKLAPYRAGKASQEDGTAKGTTRGSGSSKKAKSQGSSKADISAGVKFPVHTDGSVTMSIAPNSVMKPLQPAAASAPVAFPVLQSLSASPPYHPLDSGEMAALVTSQTALPLGVPINTFASSPSPVPVPVPDVPMQSHLPLIQSQPVPDTSPVVERQKIERSLVDEIKRDKEAFADVQKDKICAPRMLIESFQQILDNKRRRMRSCLTEDCKNLLGEFTKIGVPFPVKWVDERKHFYIKDIVTNLLPYHMFYYEELRPKGEARPQRDYSRVEDEIKELKKTIIGMKVKSPLVHQALRTCMRFRREEIRIIEKVTEEYEKTPPEALKSSTNESLREKKKRMIRYVYYDPTLAQKLAIMKARFFATGWIWVVTAILTYIASNGLYFANRHFEKGRYCI